MKCEFMCERSCMYVMYVYTINRVHAYDASYTEGTATCTVSISIQNNQLFLL